MGTPNAVILGAVVVLILAPASTQGLPAYDLTGLVGETVTLPCKVDTDRCGDLHSIKWYRGSARIFVFSDRARISRPEGEYTERAELNYSPNSTESTLKLRDLRVADEAVYKCEITYIEVREGCAVVQFINLTALIKPEYVKAMLRNGTELSDGREIGPYTEGDELTLVCQSGGGKPIPAVSWWNGTQRMPATNEQRAGSNGAGTGVATLAVRLGRGDLRATYQCRAHNDALQQPLTASLRLLVHVRPLELQLTGVKEHVVQGTNVAAVCQAVGANPEATITWYNGTDRINNTAGNVVDQQEDGTFTTRNTLIFQATLYENERTLHCEASNPVMAQREDKPMRKSVKLEVLYPPIVTVKPDNITVNESSDITLECEYVANPTTLLAVRWYRDKQLVVLNADHYEGGTTDQTTLLIKNATRYDQGVYECGLENDVGAENSTNSINVSIYFKPVVRLSMEPETPVSEVSRLNITLLCEVVAGNPPTLTAVRWYLDGELLKQLPDCNATDDAAATFCDVDPSRLMLEDVGRGFHANYSCEGMNDAGWGPTSPDRELVVFYPPGPATLVYEPSRVVKKGTVTLTCSVEDPGRPETTKFRWIRGSHNISTVTSANWTIDPVTLETESNFTCLAYNEGGEGEPATVFIEVLAPPSFINTSPPYFGAAVNAQNLNISCRVECSPICEVNWLKNNVLIDTSNGSASPYTVINKRMPADTAANDFQSILSTLLWNMSAWPGKQLDILHDSANYTCLSTSNSVGPGVNSTTVFRVEYPPGNITVSNKVVYVTEGHVPEKVLCNAKAYPEASYQWRKEGEKEAKAGKTLMLNVAVYRKDSGNYICEASNKHGSITQKTTLNVLYKPECGIIQTEMDGKLVLTCSTTANPPEVDFTWRIKNENDTIEENVEKKGQISILTLESYVENFRTYLCFANNSVGVGIPCERDVTGHAVTWWGRFESDHIIVIIAVIVGAILMVIIVCVIIIIICRRKRADDKYNNPVELEERENPDGNASVTPSQNPARPVHKWPLRPGVLVHVNGSHSLNFGRLHQTTHDNAASSNTPNYSLPYSSNTMPKNLAARKERTKKCTRKLKQRRAVSLSSLRHDDTNQHSRANKIRQMFVNDGTKYHCDTLPGIFHGKSGVVTFKKLEGPINYSVSRKRKKPGSGPNPSATKDKSKPDLTSSLGDGLLQPDGDKAFYENLPFHGMQSAPNKLAASSSNANSTSRPTSQLSHCGSSGYGSTRSHVSPHFKKTGSDSFLTDKRYHSFREYTRGIRRTSQKLVPKFYSLRMYKRDKQRMKEDKKKVMMDVLKKDTSSHAVENQQQETNLDTSCKSDEVKNKPVLPTPAPRRQTASKLVKHTYQNVPIPIKPNSLELTTQPKSQVHQHHHHHHHHYNLTSHHLLINPTNTSVDMTRQQHLQQQQQQQLQPRQQNQLQNVYGSNSAKRNNRTYLPPLRLEYQQPYYVTDPFTTNSIVYADLSLSANGIQQETHFPQSNRPPQNSTEYAILKFHDVGQEIDV